ncbi:methionine ABC transporter ATP-binding protein [Sporanaerobium hydrogeniformans]|uniref:Methionine ABC transporter ATP-binding protein n=1 Tax=Sporanaerobium hydrogeniformans TaxID=3072179 RepID=A0AC61D7V9_9FIRM|nr:methionine ABC transporter ATP-binding protein [Sporanaerobium hydrogeniformans]PHV69333.1 methionine ABC transporter ATP-binding protein [Sporanaerobium hydrogeniformans]
MIRFENVKVIFQQKQQELVAVNNVSFHIKQGEIYGIVGGSGAGKSTLVRTINGLQKPTSGRIFIEGEDITAFGRKEIRELRKKVGMIFQHFNLISRKTVGQNIEFALKVHNISKKERQIKVKELLELVGLEDKEHVYPASLSGGQKQRVGIARALAAEPKILLCDEATSALDVQTTEEIVDILRDINTKLGITIVFITHQMEVAKKLFTKVAVMNKGEIIEENSTYEIFANPIHAHTKELVKNDIVIPQEIARKTRGDILKLIYRGDKSIEPIIAYTNKKYDVILNILHGRIEYIQQKPIGTLVVSIEGKMIEVQRALTYIRASIEEVQVVKESEAV